MALKGFLASGFQKLIGASRLKGANERFLGEYNAQDKSTTTFPIAETLNDGFNLIRYTNAFGATYTSGALFSSNPTTNTVVTISNTSVSGTMLLNNFSIAGGLILSTPSVRIMPGQSITLMYDTTTARWREISRSMPLTTLTEVSISGVITDFLLQSINSEQYVTINSSYVGLTSLSTMTPQSDSRAPMRVTIVASMSLPEANRVVLVAATNTASSNVFVMNGDFELGKGYSISFYYNGTNWQELSRQTLLT